MISDEQVGSLLRSQAECKEETAQLRSDIRELRRESRDGRRSIRESITGALAAMDQQHAELRDRVEAEERREERRGGMLLAGRVLGGLILTGLGAVSSWLLLGHIAHGDTLALHSAKVVSIEAQIERHESEDGHDELRSRVRETEGTLRELGPTIQALAQEVDELSDEVRELRRRRPR